MIRPYTHQDKIKVIDLLRQNTPKYFDPSEENDLVKYLEHELQDYFVYEENSQIMGAGGINYFPEEKSARISWDIIHPQSQGRGIGRKLIEHRISHIKNNKNIDSVIVRTSQHVYSFYKKMGFTIEKVEKDYWAKDYHLYLMTMPL